MTSPRESTCPIASRDHKAAVDLGLDSGTVNFSYTDPTVSGTLSFQTKVSDADWRALKQAALSPAPSDEELRFRLERMGDRAGIPLRRLSRTLAGVAHWILHSGENTNHTYELAPLSKKYLAHTVATATGAPVETCAAYIAEA